MKTLNRTFRFAMLLFFAFMALVACTEQKDKTTLTDFYIGTYTDGDSRGIYKATLDEEGKLALVGLAAELTNPSYLTKTSDGKTLVAISEISRDQNPGDVTSFKIKPDTLLPIGTQSSGGAHPCFVAVNDAGYVLTANYTGGNVGLLQLNSRGELSEVLDIKQHVGSDINPSRQGEPHAHSAWFVPGTNMVLAVDLGTNDIWTYTLDTATRTLQSLPPDTLAMAPGAGPRHLCFHPNGEWIYVLNELDCTVTRLSRKQQQFQIHESISTLPEDFTDKNKCAQIVLSPDGRFVYASNRGHNSLAIFSVNEATGELTLVGFESTRGETPRNFALSPDGKFVVVANKDSNNLVSFQRNAETGLLQFINEIEVPNPVCVGF